MTSSPGRPDAAAESVPVEGIAVIDKPSGWTSHDVVAKSRGVLGTRKVGHSGTLDPSATGVLVLGVGRATRLLRYLTELPKSYTGEIVLGVETDSLDADGVVVATHDMAVPSLDDVAAAAATLTGAIEQVPPMVSAVKIDGRRLHQLAREGKEVERPPRPVTVHRFDVTPLDADAGIWRCEVDCSSGTYVRSLAADLGTALGGGAHLRNLRRTAVGGFSLADAGTIEAPTILPIEAAVAHLDTAAVDATTATAVGHGRVLDLDALGVAAGSDATGPWAVFGPDARLLAVYEAHKGRAKPALVLAGG